MRFHCISQTLWISKKINTESVRNSDFDDAAQFLFTTKFYSAFINVESMQIFWFSLLTNCFKEYVRYHKLTTTALP
jgi:hypothetical protein